MVDGIGRVDSVQSVRHEDAVVSVGSSVHLDLPFCQALLSVSPPGVSSNATRAVYRGGKSFNVRLATCFVYWRILDEEDLAVKLGRTQDLVVYLLGPPQPSPN